MAGIHIDVKMRPCLVGHEKKRCLFHGLFQDSDVYAPSLMVGGHNGGVVAGPVAIVETEDGSLIRVNPIDIKFLETKHDEYSWTNGKNEENEND